MAEEFSVGRDGAMARRRFLRNLGLAVAVGATGGVATRAQAQPTLSSPLLFHSPALTPYIDEVAPLPTVRGADHVVRTVSTMHRYHSGVSAAPAMAYEVDGVATTVLGPTLEAVSGQRMSLTLTNDLGPHPFARDLDTSLHGVSPLFRTSPPTVLHLHGGLTPPDSDGHAEQLVHYGRTLRYEFPFRQEAAHFWYHDHAMGITRANVYGGLAGNVLLRDRFDTGEPGNPLGLPAGEFEMPLVLQEKILNPDGRASLRSTPVVPEGSWEGGAVGDLGVVNGAVWPRIPVARGLYRFRMINAGSYSVWNLYLDHEIPFLVIGNDGGLLDAPVETRHLRVAPGERYDVLVDFGAVEPGTAVRLLNDEAPPLQAAQLGAVAMPHFCRFDVTAARGHTGAIPNRLRDGGSRPEPLPPIATPDRHRVVTVSQPYALRLPPAYMALNNLRYTDGDIESPRAGTTERWDIVNITADPHPIHLHLVHFRILERVPLRTVELQLAHPQPAVGTKWTPSPEPFLAGPGLPPVPWESGWKDTVRLDPGTVTRIVVRFPTAEELDFDPDAVFPRPPEPGALASYDHAAHSAPAGDLQGYMWHCHILDHEDHEMMLRYRVIR